MLAYLVEVSVAQTHLSSVGEVQSILQPDAGHPLQSYLIGLALYHAQAEHSLVTHSKSLEVSWGNKATSWRVILFICDL